MNLNCANDKIMVTGSGGFIGRHLVTRLCEGNFKWRPLNFKDFYEFDRNVDFSEIDAIIHLASMVHILREPNEDDVKNYWAVNVDATKKLAIAAAASGVKRFIFISSIKVNGERTFDNDKFKPTDSPRPVGSYAQSKYQAEIELMEVSAETGMEVVIIRPPLVYGPGVKANFRLLEKLISLKLPLPLSGIDNKRSVVSVFNLTELIVMCIHHKSAANKVFLVADGAPCSTSELVKKIARAMRIKSSTFFFPRHLLYSVFNLLGKLDAYSRLFDSLQVDFSETSQLLGWKPRFSTQESLDKTYSEIG